MILYNNKIFLGFIIKIDNVEYSIYYNRLPMLNISEFEFCQDENGSFADNVVYF